MHRVLVFERVAHRHGGIDLVVFTTANPFTRQITSIFEFGEDPVHGTNGDTHAVRNVLLPADPGYGSTQSSHGRDW